MKSRTLIVAVVAGLLTGGAVGVAEMRRSQPATPGCLNPLQLMSFNIRFGSAADGANSWANRRNLVFQVLLDHAPDVVGIQEAERFQLDEIAAAVAGYGEVGEGRSGGTNGEYSAILYRLDRFQLLESDTFWLSPTPEVTGSTGWGAPLPRIVTWARLLDLQTQRSFYVANTHFSAFSQLARYNSALLLLDRIAPWTDPVLVTGDFNAGELNPAVVTIIQQGGVVDTYRFVNQEVTNVGTFNGFSGVTTGEKIDYIFARRSEARMIQAEILLDNTAGQYPSDHFPLTAVVDLVDCNANCVIDDMELSPATDCDGDNVLDECEIAADARLDCNGTGVLDTCEEGSGAAPDCNGNQVPDVCEFVMPAPVSAVDGTADAGYGVALSVQDTQTQFGDNSLSDPALANGSELDAAYGVIRGGVLYLVVAGNLESNFNKIEVFIDSVPGGQNQLRGDNPIVAGDGLNRMGGGSGLTFDVGFEADFWISFEGDDDFDGGGNPYQLGGYYAELLTTGNGAGYPLGATGATSDGTLYGGANPHRIRATIDNSNVGGVGSGIGVDSGAGVVTGLEIAIPLSAIGSPVGTVDICVFVNGAQHDFISNQVLGPLGGGSNLGEPRNVDFATISGLQHFEVPVVEDVFLAVDVNGNGIPDACDAVAIPTVSQWALVVLALGTIAAGTIVFRRRGRSRMPT